MIKRSTTILGKKSGPPPEKGPASQGLKFTKKPYTTEQLEKLHGRNRQKFVNHKARS
jgi:hypothetical protein